MSSEYPVDDSLTVLRGEDIYKKERWRKSVVQYYFEDYTDSVETAVYLWHKEDGRWKRKNKYVVKSKDAWEEDRELVRKVMNMRDDDDADETFPVSDYYSVAAGETAFKTEEWWKAIVRIDEKGEYETQDTIIYLWQRREGDWRRRQKFSIKDPSDWETVKEIIDDMLTCLDDEPTGNEEIDDEDDDANTGELGLQTLSSKSADRLSIDLRKGWNN